MSNIVAIVGRPNVGKSTLFNRLTESRQAIVDNVSGVTRDRHYGFSEWTGRTFTVIDTGGFVAHSEDVFEKAIREQVHIAIEEATVLLFIVDITTGVTDMDDHIAAILRRSNKPVLVVANKMDNNKLLPDIHEFYSLGLGEVYGIAANSGSGTGELLDQVVSHLQPDTPGEAQKLPGFAIVGRPNVGKSSLINALIGKDRNIVTNVAGTTRDAIETVYNQFGYEFRLIDTAGLRKKTKVKENIEFYSVMRTIKAVEQADVCILMIDAGSDFESQDVNIFRLAEKKRKGLVIVVNKWDLIEKTQDSTRQYEKQIREKIAPFTDVPVLFTSVPGKQRILKVIETAFKVYKNREKRIPTSKLNEVMLEIINQTPPPSLKGKYIRIKYATQLKSATPAFAFFCNLPQYVKEPYQRFLENKLRENFDFSGVPVSVYFRQK